MAYPRPFFTMDAIYLYILIHAYLQTVNIVNSSVSHKRPLVVPIGMCYFFT